MHSLGVDFSEDFEYGDYEEDEGEEDESVAIALAPPPPESDLYMPTRSYPVRWHEDARENAGDYYDAVCAYAPELYSSLLQRDASRNWDLLKSGRFSRLMALVDKDEHADCPELMDAWAPETAAVEPAELRDYGPRPQDRMTFVSALMTEIHYFLGQTEERAELSSIGTADQLLKKALGRERGRATYVTGVIYGEGTSLIDVEKLAMDTVGSLLRTVFRALGLKSREEFASPDPFLEDVRVAIVGAPGIIRFGIQGGLSAVQVVAYVKWAQKMTLEGAALRSEAILGLLKRQYEHRGFSEYLLAPKPLGADFFLRMRNDISTYFDRQVSNSIVTLTPRKALDDIRLRGGRSPFFDPVSNMDPVSQKQLEQREPDEEIELFRETWFWANWNYALYTRTAADLAWFMKIAPDTVLNIKSPAFIRLVKFFALFYDRKANGISEYYAVPANSVGAAQANLRELGVEFKSPLFRLLDHPFYDQASASVYPTNYALRDDGHLPPRYVLAGSETAPYGDSAFPWFVMTAERARLVQLYLS